MSDVSAAGNTTNIFEQINKANQSASTVKPNKAEEQQGMFMNLLIAQLKNQSPTSPTDTSQFMSQVSQMSMVESVTKMEDSINNLSSNMLNSQSATQASAMVGQRVFVDSDTAVIEAGQESLGGVLELPQSSSNVRVKVFDDSDTLVKTVELGQLSAGDQDYSIDTSDMQAGRYRVVAEAQVDGKFQALNNFVAQEVNSVTLGQNGQGMTVNTDLGRTPVNEIKQIAA